MWSPSNGHKLFFPFLENAICLAPSSLYPDLKSCSSQSWVLVSISTPSTLFLQPISLSNKAVQCLSDSSHACIHIQTLTIVFCLTVPISFLSGSKSEFFPFQSWSALITVSIVLAASRSSSTYFSPVLYSACPCCLPIYYLHQISLSPHSSFCFHSLSWKEFQFLTFQFYMMLCFSDQSLPFSSASWSPIPFFTVMSSPGSLLNLCSLWCQVLWALAHVLRSNPPASTSPLLMGATDNPPMEEVLCCPVRCLAHGQPREQLYTAAIAEEVFFSPGWKNLWQRSSLWKLVMF